jgi:hypothetical protein
MPLKRPVTCMPSWEERRNSMSAYVIHMGLACTAHVKSLKLASSVLLIYTVYVYIGVVVRITV